MNKTLLALLVTIAAVSCNQSKSTADNTEVAMSSIASQENKNSFGAAFSESNAVSVNELQTLLDSNDSFQTTLVSEITSSCQAKGCWMDVKLADNSTMKVTFRDYGFFVPIADLSGRKVVFTGIAKKEITSVEDQRHYAGDAGKTKEEIAAITSPKEEIRFVADGVVLK